MEKANERDASEAQKETTMEVHGVTDYAIKERKLVRKIDWMLLPLMLVAYLLQFLDKSGLTYSTIMGLLEDLNLVGDDYNWASSIFYFGYLAASYPVSIILVKLPLGKCLGTLFLIWSIILACTAATQNFSGLMAVRFFLGVAEAGISPGFSLLTSLWYRTSEQPLRHGIWFCGNSLSGIFGTIIGYGVYHIHGEMASWKWLFIILALATFAWGLLLLWRLPDHPGTASFLTEEEKLIALERLRANQAGFKTNKLDRKQIIEALTDQKTWWIVLYTLGANIPNGGYTTFTALILDGFGFSTVNTYLMALPMAAVIIVSVIITCLISTKVKNSRCITIAVVNSLGIIGAALIYKLDGQWGEYAGLVIMGIFSSGMPLVLAMISSNFGGFTKRATVSALLFLAYCTGNIIGPQLFFAREAPKYKSGFLSMMVCFAVSTVAITVLRVQLQRENKRRDREYPVVEQSNAFKGTPELVDITDLENKDFRYCY